ncbi:hypothetical protein K501DRAFT_283410 [Backusella circina FSU 941]|nr:hypothetical protein K501DRAFT_283410 [Backusella circina FSU 941]
MFISSLLASFCFTTCASATLLNKRQVVTPLSCGNEENTVSICSPSGSSVWYNNTDQEFTWKYNNPKFDQYDTIDLYLLHLNDSGYYQTQKLWPSLSTAVGVSVQLVDDSWYPVSIKDNSPNVSWTMYAYVAGAGYDIQSDLAKISTSHNYFPAPQSFTLIQSAHNTSTTASGATSSASPSSTDNSASSGTYSTSHSNGFPGWAIAVICIAAILVIAAAAILFWVIRRNRNRKNRPNESNGNNEKILIPDNINVKKNDDNDGSAAALAAPISPTETNLSPTTPRSQSVDNTRGENASIHSSTPFVTQPQWSPRSLSPRYDETSSTSDKALLNLQSEVNQSSSILSSTDALMIADTFRQFMRKPEWNESADFAEKENKEGGRQRLGDELLQRQLKKEGTQVHSVEKSRST